MAKGSSGGKGGGQGLGGFGFSGSVGQPSSGSAYGGGGQGLGNTGFSGSAPSAWGGGGQGLGNIGFSGTIGQPTSVSAPGPVGPSIAGFNLSDIDRIPGPELIQKIKDLIAIALSQRQLAASAVTPPSAVRPGSLTPLIPASPYAGMLAGGGAPQQLGLLQRMMASPNRRSSIV